LLVADTDEELLAKMEEAMRDKKAYFNGIGFEIQEDQTKLWAINSKLK